MFVSALINKLLINIMESVIQSVVLNSIDTETLIWLILTTVP